MTKVLSARVDDAAVDASGSASTIASLARWLVLGRLANFTAGRLVLSEGGRDHVFGDPSPDASPRAHIVVRSPALWKSVLLRGTVGAAEAYVRGEWSADDLVLVTRLFVRNRRAMSTLESGLARLSRPFLKLFHRARRNTRKRAVENIREHYDLGNDFYSLFLDSTMSYSCAIFADGAQDLEQASIAKLDRVFAKLELSRDDHLLEIGSGWGALACRAAERFGCRVTTTTISAEQFAYANELVRKRGLEGRVEVLLRDYRDLEGVYSKVVSIEMIEAVGLDRLNDYFRRVSNLTAPGGLAVVQGILIADRYFDEAAGSVDFIQRYVFPGSALPSYAAIAAAIARETDLRTRHVEDIGPHYAPTLAAWRRRFFENVDKVGALGFSERDVRLWDYYFCYCEGGFLEGAISVAQFVWSKPERNRPSAIDA